MDIRSKIKDIKTKNKNLNSCIKLNYYNAIPNLGDILNVILMDKIFGLNVEYARVFTAQLQSIGSILDLLFLNPISSNFFRKYIKQWFYRKTQAINIWGTGFINEDSLNNCYLYRNLNIYALRGELSLNKLKSFTKNGDIKYIGDKITLADPGLLASLFLEELPLKKYKVGIIPHYIHLGNEQIIDLSKKYEDSIIINVLDNPLDVIFQIAQCEIILSTSLHGLILADSFSIPNQWLHISSLTGNYFKFLDYYSAFGLESSPIDLNKYKTPNLDNIKSDYRITPKMVLEKQNLLIESFPYK